MKLKYVLRQIKPADRYPSVVRSLRDVPTDDTLIEAAQDEAVHNITSKMMDYRSQMQYRTLVRHRRAKIENDPSYG